MPAVKVSIANFSFCKFREFWQFFGIQNLSTLDSRGPKNEYVLYLKQKEYLKNLDRRSKTDNRNLSCTILQPISNSMVSSLQL